MSGARILAVGFTAEDSKKKPEVESIQKKVEPVTEGVPQSKELKKLWTEAMLLPEEKDPPLVEWNSVRFNKENNSDNVGESFKQEEKFKTSFDLPAQEQKEKILKLKNVENLCEKKMVSSSRVGSISNNTGDKIVGSVSDTVFATENNSNPLASDVAVRSTNYSLSINASVISEGMPKHPCTKEGHGYQHLSLTSGVESSEKITEYGKKLNMKSVTTESPIESQKLFTESMEASQKTHKIAFSSRMKPKNKHLNFSWSPDSVRQEKLTKSSTFASQLMQEIVVKQEPDSDESWSHMNNITLYRADGSDAPEKCEMAVVNANRQPLAISPSSATYRSCSPGIQSGQRSSSVMFQPQFGKSGIRPSINKASRANDKRKLKIQTQPFASASKASKANLSVCEGSAIIGYQCPKCSKVYQTEWLMMKHSVTHFKYHCDICYQVYPDENMMKIHLLDHLSGAYEDEKYYCQFSCKVCHSLKCGCFEPTYCKPKDLPRIFFKPQKARRSKRGFTSKLNSGPNDHLKISLANYKKLIISGSVGPHVKEIMGISTPTNSTHAEDIQTVTLLNDPQKSITVGDSQMPNEVNIPSTTAETQKPLHSERDQGFLHTKEELNHRMLLKEKCLDASTGVSGTYMEARPNSNAPERNDVKMEKKLNWNEVRTKFTFSSKRHPDSQPYGMSSSRGAGNGRGTKRGGGRKRGTAKFAKNFTYKDTDFYYMCEICDANFSTKSDLSEHMFLHRLKSRSRRGEKRSISSVIEGKEFSKKIKLADRANPETAENLDNYICELCLGTFPTAADYRAHKILAHKEPKTDSAPQNNEVYRCNYCDKIYRRKRELKRHLKRDCTCAPSSLKGALAGRYYSGNVIDEIHYTTLKINFDDRSDASSKSSGKSVKGPIVCRYCLAVTKREAEMKRHIWKFCLKVPAEVVKKFMDGVSLEELGFKYIKDDQKCPENLDAEVSKSTDMDISEAPISLDKTPSNTDLHVSNSTSCKKTSPANIFEESNSANKSSEERMEISPVQSDISGNNNIYMTQGEESKETTAQPEFTTKQSPVKHLPKEIVMNSPSTIRETEQSPSSLGETKQSPSSASETKQSPSALSETKQSLSASGETKQSPSAAGKTKQSLSPISETEQSSSVVSETEQSSTSTSPLASPVMQFPIVLPVMTASAKSKRPLVCGYCGIWYFREMAILKHMRERCIKIPELEKKLLKINPVLCNVSQKAGGSGSTCENGAVYKMVKVPEHMQNTPVPMPKDVSNEDIKELNANISVFNEYKPAKPAEAKGPQEQENQSSLSVEVKEQEKISSSSTLVKRDHLSSSLKAAEKPDSLSSIKEKDNLLSSPVKEHDSLSSSDIKIKEQNLSSVKEQDSLSLPSAVVKDHSFPSSSTRVKEQDCLSLLSGAVTEQSRPLLPSTVIKEKDSVSSPSTEIKEHDSLSSPFVPKEHRNLSSPSTLGKVQDDLLSSSVEINKQDAVPPSAVIEQDSLSHTAVKEQEHIFSSSTKVKEQGSLSPIVVKEQGSLSQASASVREQERPSPSSVSPSLKVNRNTTSKRGSRCRRCHELFGSLEAVLAHSSVHHGPKKGFYKCKLCHARLAKYKQLREHVWEHTDESPYRCHLCEVKYRSSDALVEHLHTQHQYTSINEKNLYKWLPGRHGRYRDIKAKSSCEEKLDDVDTSLDSLAEVMVITDRDICSKTSTPSKSEASDIKATEDFETSKQSVDSKHMQENITSLLTDTKSSSITPSESDTLNKQKMASNSGIIISTHSDMYGNEVNKAVKEEKVNNLPTDQNTLEKTSEMIPCSSGSVIDDVTGLKEKGRERNAQNDDSSKSEREDKVQSQKHNETSVIAEVKTEDKISVKHSQAGLDDDFTGEGLIPLVENLDSIVETVHLTDNHLS